jgi:dCTP deaminase
MSVSQLSDRQIRALCQGGSESSMIYPFTDNQIKDRDTGYQGVHEKIVSYGLSSYGYDVRVGNDFKIFTNADSAEVDPKRISRQAFVEKRVETGQHILVPPNSFALAVSVEILQVPRDILVICIGKSTYARCGIVVNVTPLEPEWRGQITLEISNTTPLPARIYAGEGLAQLVFLKAEEVCETSYADRNGKYMDQVGIVLPKV